MFELPPKIAQATEAMVLIGLQSSLKPISGKQLADHLGVPPRFLEQTMQLLVHAGLLRSVRGPRGGYTLAREKRHISLRDISEALCENRYLKRDAAASAIGQEVVMKAYLQAEEQLMNYLDTVTLVALCDAARSVTMDGTAPQSAELRNMFAL